MTPDLINGLFEFFGAVVNFMNVRALLRDQKLAGVRILPTVFFSAWGVWNLYYYPHLAQWWSFAGGCAIVLCNVVWVVLAIKYTRAN